MVFKSGVLYSHGIDYLPSSVLKFMDFIFVKLDKMGSQKRSKCDRKKRLDIQNKSSLLPNNFLEHIQNNNSGRTMNIKKVFY